MFKPSDICKYKKSIKPVPLLRRCWNPVPLEEASAAFYTKKQSIKELNNLYLLLKLSKQDQEFKKAYIQIITNYFSPKAQNNIFISIQNKTLKYLTPLALKIKNKKQFEDRIEKKLNEFVLEGDMNIGPFLARNEIRRIGRWGFTERGDYRLRLERIYM